MNGQSASPPEEVVREAKRYPGGWVYQVDAGYDCKGYVPPHAISGAWQVDERGQVIGDFVPNPYYAPAGRRG